MNRSDKKYYENKEYQDKKSQKARNMAKARGDAAAIWLKVNKLTPETKPEFDKLMREVNKQFKKQNPSR